MIKHRTRGLRWLGGGSNIYSLLLKNDKNEVIEIATVGLGLNEGDEFLKAVNGTNEYVLSPRFFKSLGYE